MLKQEQFKSSILTEALMFSRQKEEVISNETLYSTIRN